MARSSPNRLSKTTRDMEPDNQSKSDPKLFRKISFRNQLPDAPLKIESHTDRVSIDVSGVPSGLYFIRLGHESSDTLPGAHLKTRGANGEESSHNVYIFSAKKQNEFFGTIEITSTTEALVFYPSRLPVEFRVSDCYIRAINNFGRDVIYGQTYVRVRSFGLHSTIDLIKGDIKRWLRRRLKGGTDDSYPTWWKLYGEVSSQELSRQREWSQQSSAEAPGISLIMPIYNNQLDLLKETINSVLQQSYNHWELCIADDASESPALRNYLESLNKTDPRIKTCFRDQHGGICNASNSALELTQAPLVGFVDPGDMLGLNALYEIMRCINDNPAPQLIYSDEDIISHEGNPLYPHFKPDWSPDLARSINYISHFVAISKDRILQVGGLRQGGYEGAHSYDLMLRVTEGLTKEQIRHIPRVLYHWRASKGCTTLDHSSTAEAIAAGKRALEDHLQRLGLNALVQASEIPLAYRVSYQLPSTQPSATLIIPTHNSLRVLKNCIASILNTTDYGNYDVLIVDNRSDDPETLDYLKACQSDKVRVIEYPHEFNYSAINNFAVKQALSEVVVLLNNDTEVCSPGWLHELVSHAIRPEVGAVGAKLFYAEDLIQHAGVLLGMGGDKFSIADHAFRGMHKNDTGSLSRSRLIQAYSAVTAACMAVKRDKYLEVGGLDEENLPIAFNDVDFCLKLQEKGYTNIWTPYAQLYHYESFSRGQDWDDKQKRERFLKERTYMNNRWRETLDSDPHYNPNMTKRFNNFGLAWPPAHESEKSSTLNTRSQDI